MAKMVFPVCEEDIGIVRRLYEKTAEDVERDVAELISWMQDQPHLPQNTDKKRLERFLLRNKYRMDKAKVKLEAYYSIRKKYPNFLKNVDPASERMVNFRKCVHWAPISILTPEKERVTIIKFLKETSDLFNFECFPVHLWNLVDVQLSHDYAVGDLFLVDMSEVCFAHLRSLKLRTVYNTMRLYQDSLSGRLLSLDFINPPPFMKIIMTLVKLAAPTKLFKRITVHGDISTVYKRLSKSCLPIEYGGGLEISIAKIHERTGEMLLSMRDLILEHSQETADETLKIK